MHGTMHPFEWIEATSVEDALSHLGNGHAAKAGGVDLLDMMKEGLASPNRVVNLRRIKGLDQVRNDSSELVIGPLVTLSDLAAHKGVRATHFALALAAELAATPQIRNMATAGGNLLQRPRCWYFRSAEFHCLKKGGDKCFAHDGENQYHAIFGNQVCAIVHPSGLATPLLAYDAVLELTSKRGKRKVKLADFFVRPEQDVRRENVLAPDELLTAIRVAAPIAGSAAAYIKQKEKQSSDWPIAEVAVVLQKKEGVVRQARIVLGAAAPIPIRATGAEQRLLGQRIDESVARSAASAAVAQATPLTLNGYKVQVLETVVRRAIMEAGS